MPTLERRGCREFAEDERISEEVEWWTRGTLIFSKDLIVTNYSPGALAEKALTGRL